MGLHLRYFLRKGFNGALALAVLMFLSNLVFLPEVVFSAADQIRTTEQLVGISQTQVSSQLNLPFSLYIGDNINPVSNAIKAAFFRVSGVYTGGGTLALEIDGNASTLKTFTMPAVSGPTSFEILYSDPTGYINPTTAGTFSYTLNSIPSGVTISGYGATITLTYRYAPGSCDDGQSANQKIKTTEQLVGISQTQVSSQLNLPFSLYIGDNINPVSNAVKAAFFRVSGVYTGGGTLALEIDGNASTLKTFTMPAVSGPTSFEILYSDPTGYINPTTAGTFSYTLNSIPSGVTISGYGATMLATYRYAPPSCGLPPTGQVTSVVFDTTGVSNGPAYNSFLWKGTYNSGNGKVRFQLATSDCPNAQTNPPTCTTAGSWSFRGGTTCSSSDWYTATTPDVPVEITCSALYHNNQRYFKYIIQLCSASDCTSSGAISPQVTDVGVNWSP